MFRRLTYSLRTLLFWTLSAGALFGAPIDYIQRASVFDVKFDPDGKFNNASVVYQIVLRATGSTGDTDARLLDLLQPAQNLSASTVSGGTVMAVSLTPVGTQANYSLTSLQSGEDNVTIQYTFLNNCASASGICVGVQNGRWALTFSGGGTGFIDAGDPFQVRITLPGDWSNPANRQFISILNTWVIATNFVYSPATNTTSFAAVGTGPTNPNIQFRLLGAPVEANPVPEPGTFGLVAIAVAAAAFVARKRQRG